MEALLLAYGYPLIFALTFLEGETIVLIAGFAAHQAWLGLEGVIASAFLGSFLGDQLYFALGRRYGPRLLSRWPAWRPAAERASALLRRHSTWFILSFRFIYGVRTVSPFVVGMSTVPTRRFLGLNFVAALIWAGLFALAGYLFGHTLEALLGDIHRIQGYTLAALLALGAIAFLGHFIHRRRTRVPTASQDR